MEIPILNEIGLLLGLAVMVVLIFRKFRLPTIIGFLVTGALMGPSGLSILTADHDIEVMAEIGVILLLFIIGLEFSLKTLASIKRAVLLGGAIQVMLTISLPAACFWLLGFGWQEAVFLGFLLALSSTAIVLKSLQERGEISTPHGKIALAILIFQDIIVVPMMLFTPLIAGAEGDPGLSLLILLGKAVLVILVVIISARYLVPLLLYEVAKTKSQELFILTVVTICIATAAMTSFVGLSLALGAFMAGLIISESEYSHQAIGQVLPFREIFSSIFFISIGMLLDLGFLAEHLLPVLSFTALVLVVKGTIASMAGFALRYPPRTALMAGLYLFQVGEFSFILSRTGITHGLLTPEVNQYFLAVSIISMAVTPFVIPRADEWVRRILNLPISRPIRALSGKIHDKTGEIQEHDYDDHLVIIGYGLNGRNVARAARHSDIPYVIIELNAETVRKERAAGEPILYGDAVHLPILEHAMIHKARIVVVAISDPVGTQKIISNIRGISKSVYLIVRTRFVSEIEAYLLLGADEVIPEEFETSIQIFSRVLRRYLVPLNDIQSVISEIRGMHYEFLRPGDGGSHFLRPMHHSDLNVVAVRVHHLGGGMAGNTLQQANLRADFGINVVAIGRADEMIHDLGPDTMLLPEDILYVVGSVAHIQQLDSRTSTW